MDCPSVPNSFNGFLFMIWPLCSPVPPPLSGGNNAAPLPEKTGFRDFPRSDFSKQNAPNRGCLYLAICGLLCDPRNTCIVAAFSVALRPVWSPNLQASDAAIFPFRGCPPRRLPFDSNRRVCHLTAFRLGRLQGLAVAAFSILRSCKPNSAGCVV